MHPAGLRKGQVHTDGVDTYVWWQRRAQLLPGAGLGVTDWRIKRVDDVEHAHAAHRVGEPHRTHCSAIKVIELEGRRRRTRLELATNDGQLLIKLKSFARSLFHG